MKRLAIKVAGSESDPASRASQDHRRSLPSPLDAPQSARPSMDTITSAAPGGNVSIFRLNQEEAPQDVYEPPCDPEINAVPQLHQLQHSEPLPQPDFSGLNGTEGVSGDIYKVLRDHQQGASEKLRLLHTYLPLIINRFYGGSLPLPALSWGPSHWGNLGWYMEKDGLELSHRINLNSLHADRPLPEILQTLTHELGHCWQQVYGHPPKPKSVRDHNFHNAEFRREMQEIGIPCNKRGVSLGIEEPFVQFLKELGIEADTIPFKREGQTPNDGPAGSDGQVSRPGSRLKPWACKCPRARVWASFKVELSATCHKCGSPFQRQ